MPGSDLHRLIKNYISGDISLFDLYDWIIGREEHWASLPTSDPAAQATSSIMLAVYERDAGDRDEDSVREIASEALKELEAAERV